MLTSYSVPCIDFEVLVVQVIRDYCCMDLRSSQWRKYHITSAAPSYPLVKEREPWAAFEFRHMQSHSCMTTVLSSLYCWGDLRLPMLHQQNDNDSIGDWKQMLIALSNQQSPFSSRSDSPPSFTELCLWVLLEESCLKFVFSRQFHFTSDHIDLSS